MLTKDKKFYKSFIVLCSTLMLEQAVILSVNLVDNLMLGNYNETALAGVAAVNQIQFVLQQLVYGISNGVITLGSQYWGQKRPEEVRKLSSIGFWMEILLTVFLFVLVSVFPHGAVGVFTTDEAIIGEGMKYLNLMRFSYVFFGLTAVMLGTMRVAEQVKIALRVSVVSLIVNVCINYLLIAGHFGCPELGAVGAAVGTLAARVIECVIVTVFMFRHEKKLQMRPKDYLRIDSQMLKDFIRIGTPIIITAALWGFANALQTIILGHMDKNAIAAQSIGNTLFLLLKVTSVGAASAAAVIIGWTVGSGEINKIKEYSRTLQVIFVGIGLTLAVLFTIIRIPMMKVYNISDETRALADAFMNIQTFVLFTMSYQMPCNAGIIRGGGDTKFILIADTIAMWVVAIPLSLLSAFLWHASPVLVTLILNSDQVTKCVPAFIHVNSYKWIKKLTRDQKETA